MSEGKHPESEAGYLDQPHANVPVENFLRDGQNFKPMARRGSILFADLMGSTEFKRDHRGWDALAKPVLHNKVVTKVVTQNSGRVIKYLGDGVLARFDGAKASLNALKAGLAIVREIAEANTAQAWEFPKAMSTKIGVHCGEIWTFVYPGTSLEDPQGETVDIASRLSQMAGPQQILCSEKLYVEALIHGALDCDNFPTKKFLRGITEVQQLRVLVPKGWEMDLTHIEGKPSPLSKEVLAGMNMLRKGNHAEAIGMFETVLNREPGNFHANMSVGAILLLNQSPPSKEQLKRILDHFCSAKWARPYSSRMWWFFSWLRFKQFEMQLDYRGNPEECLSMAIRYAEDALACATDAMNTWGIAAAKVYLAYYLCVRSKANPRTRREDVARSSALSGEVDQVITGTVNELLLVHYATRAHILLASGPQGEGDHKVIEKLTDLALAIDPKNVLAHDARGELMRVRGGNTIAPGLGTL